MEFKLTAEQKEQNEIHFHAGSLVAELKGLNRFDNVFIEAHTNPFRYKLTIQKESWVFTKDREKNESFEKLIALISDSDKPVKG